MEDLKGTKAWDLARDQFWLITLAQLVGLGFTARQVELRVAAKRLWRVYPGVFAVGHPGMTPEREWMAAVLSCGVGAGLSHFSAAIHRQVWEGAPPARHHVTLPSRSGRPGAQNRADGEDRHTLSDRILIHRPRLLLPDEIEVAGGIPTTTLTRTLTDLAQYLKPWQLKGPMRQAERVHDYDLHLLRAAVDEAASGDWRRQRVKRALLFVLSDSGTTQTEREALFLDICKRHRIPQPTPQHPIGTRRADFLYELLRLIVEIDDRGSHRGDVAFLEDRRRDRQNLSRGLATVRFTVSECKYEPKLVARDTLAAIAQRVADLNLDPRPWGLGPDFPRTPVGYPAQAGRGEVAVAP